MFPLKEILSPVLLLHLVDVGARGGLHRVVHHHAQVDEVRDHGRGVAAAVEGHRHTPLTGDVDQPLVMAQGKLTGHLRAHDQAALLPDVVCEVDERDPQVAGHA